MNLYMFVTPPPMPLTWDVDVSFRQGRMSMMQAGKKMMLSPRQLAVFSKACVLTWMGKWVFWVYILLLTLAQIWLCPYIHC